MPKWINKVFLAATLYYLFLGVTGLWWHSAWYFVSGINPVGAEFIMDTFGGLMLTLAVASVLGLIIPSGQLTLLLVLVFSNIFDASVILASVQAGTLGIGPALLFIVADIVWLGVLGATLFHYYRNRSHHSSDQPITSL